MKRISVVLSFLIFVPAVLGSEAIERRLRDLSVPFYFDLGQDSIDVSEYPKTRRRQYRLFALRCAACHTLARAVNATTRGREEWEYYVHRMRLFSLTENEIRARKTEYEDIIDFLVYDSRIRKIKHGAEFEENDRRLRLEFNAIHEERVRLLREIIEHGGDPK